MGINTDIILPTNFDVSKMTFGEVRPLKSGGKAIYIAYDGGKNLKIQTPEMNAPFGIGVSSYEGNGDKYHVNLSFDGAETRPLVQSMLNMLIAISKRVVDEAMANSYAWLKKDKFASREVAEELFTPIVKYAKEKETGKISNRYAPTFKISLPMKESAFMCEAFAPNREELDLLALAEKGSSLRSRMRAIVRVSNVWIVGNKFGVTFKAEQLVIAEQAQLTGWAFMKTEEDSEYTHVSVADAAAADDLADEVESNLKVSKKKATVSKLENSSDEEGGAGYHEIEL